MTLDDLGNLGDFLGAIAVLVTLVGDDIDYA